MELYTLTEASEILKKHNISADYKKLVREASLAKINLSIAVHGHFYSPTINNNCLLVMSNYQKKISIISKRIADVCIENKVIDEQFINNFDFDKLLNIDSDEVPCAFATDIIEYVFNSPEYEKLSLQEIKSYLFDGPLVKDVIKRHNTPSLSGYYIVLPAALLAPVNNVFTIKGVSDGRDIYFINKEATFDELFITEQHLNQYIESFSTTSSKPQNKSNNISSNITTDDKPWLIANSSDPVAPYTWYIPARYFARELLKTEPTLLEKIDILASRVNTLFKKYGIKKRGGKKDFDDSTIKKAFSNVNFG
jgi:hypothetical protein